MTIEAAETVRWITLSKGVTLTIISAVVGYAVYKLTQKAENKVEDAFGSTIRRSAAHWLAPKLNLPEEQIEKALVHWINEGKQSPILASVLRIEYEVTRGKTECLVKVVIALVQEVKVVMGEVTRKIDTADLPQDIRDEFIRSADKDTQFFSLLNANKTNF